MKSTSVRGRSIRLQHAVVARRRLANPKLCSHSQLTILRASVIILATASNSPDAGAIADLHIRQEDVPKGWMVWDERGWSTGEAPDVK